MNGIVTGVKANGERVQFEEWVYNAWRDNQLTDGWLLSIIGKCVRFYYN